jgi:hypothetical protein
VALVVAPDVDSLLGSLDELHGTLVAVFRGLGGASRLVNCQAIGNGAASGLVGCHLV